MATCTQVGTSIASYKLGRVEFSSVLAGEDDILYKTLTCIPNDSDVGETVFTRPRQY